MKQFGIIPVALALLALAPALRVGATEVRWVTAGAGTYDWFNTNNWSTTNIPAAGDDVIINYTNINVLLTNSTAELASLLMSNSCTLIFSNWDTALTASNVSIWNNAKMTCIGYFKNNEMSNRVYVVCTNFTLQSGGSVDVIGRGYTNANGPGTPTGDDNISAGSHGGWGGGYVVRAPYGSAEAPLFPGSGANPGLQGFGGGAVWIDAASAVIINGGIYANGSNGYGNYNAGGSGGSIYITCRTLAGTGGIVRANGGNHASNSGGGGGGRIAVVYDTAAQSNEPLPSITFSALAGSGSYVGDIGTLYFTDNQLLTNPIPHSGVWMSPGFTNFPVSALTITNNAQIRFPADGLLLNVAGDLRIYGSAKLFLGSNDFRNGASDGAEPFYANMTTSGPTLRVGGNLVLTNTAQLHIYSGDTNGALDYGALVAVTGDVFVASGSKIYLYSQQANTNSFASPLLTARNVTVAGTIFAGGQGCRAGRIGPGKGSANAAGAGYGGKGGYTGGGPTYGSSNAPMHPGSSGAAGGGAYKYRGGGGSLVRIEAESMRVDGTINADGNKPVGASLGGGSGGGIFIICNQFEGGGALYARGGGIWSGTAGGGGGGRIAVWFDARNIGWLTQKLRENPNYIPKQVDGLPLFSGTVSVAGGAGSSASYYGTNGTIMFIQLPAPGTIFTVH